MAIIPKPEVKPGVPNSPTSKTTVNPAVPNNLTSESATTPAVPNSPTAKNAVVPGVPNSPTAKSVSTPAVPNTATAKSVVVPAVPNSPTSLSPSSVPRVRCPVIGLNFADELYSINGVSKSISEVLTYSRSSSATFTNRTKDLLGRWKYFLDTDFVGSVTNLVTYSEDFTNSAWTKTNSTITANVTISPDGTKTADKLIENTSAATHSVNNLTTMTVDRYTYSVYLKAAERIWALVWVDGISKGAYFNLQSGTIGTDTTDGGSAIEYVRDGWYRCSITIDSPDTSNNPAIYIALNNGVISYTGDGSSGIYTWGSQFTLSRKPLPYVKTVSTSATKAFTASPRLEYDPNTGEALGYLSEGSSTNLALYSEQLDDPTWNKLNISVVANNAVSPDSTKSMDKITETAVNDVHQISDGFTLSDNTSYTTSIYAKRAERAHVRITTTNKANSTVTSYFNISNGTVQSQGVGHIAKIKPGLNGGYRISVTFDSSTGVTPPVIRYALSDGNQSTNYLGVASNGLYLWGIQLEALPFASSYIRTEGSTVSRSADDMYMSSYLTPNEANSVLTIHAEAQAPDTGSIANTGTVWSYNSSYSRLIYWREFGFSAAYGYHGGSNRNIGNISDEESHKLTYSFDGTNFKIYFDGVLSGAHVDRESGDNATRVYIGKTSAASALFGHTKELKVYDFALTAQEVALL